MHGKYVTIEVSFFFAFYFISVMHFLILVKMLKNITVNLHVQVFATNLY